MKREGRKEMERELARWVSPERVKAIADGQLSPGCVPCTRSGQIEFLFVLLRAPSLDLLSERMGIVVDMSHTQGAVVHHLVGPLIVIAFGTFPHDPSSPELRRTLVGGLHQRLDGDIKILHGSVLAHYGNIGTPRLASMTFVFPRFDQALAMIGRLEFGQAEEFTE